MGGGGVGGVDLPQGLRDGNLMGVEEGGGQGGQ